jgi:hypothetical protein
VTEGAVEQKAAGRASAFAWLARVVCALVFVMIALTFVLAVANRYDPWDVAFLVAVASAALVGVLVASRQPRNPVGWFVLGHAFCFALGEFGRQYAIYGVFTEPGSLPFARAMIWPTYWVWYPGLILMFSLLPLYFPDGRLVSPGWRWASVTVVVYGTLATGLAMVRPGDSEAPGIPNPLGIEGLRAVSISGTVWSDFGYALTAGWLLLGAVGVASLVTRFVRSRGEERQQLKWFVYAAVLFLSTSIISKLLLLPSAVGSALFLVTLEGLWVALGVAILKHRLYDIDVVINRTLVYAGLSAALAALYFGAVVVLQGLFVFLTGEGSTLAVVVSTLIIAGLFNPFRIRMQTLVDRRFYRRKYDARKTLEAFAAGLRDETDLVMLKDRLVGVVSETMQPEHISLWLRPDAAPEGERRG